MRNFTPLVRRELGVYFVSPMAYVILTALLFVVGGTFVASLEGFVAARLPVDYRMTLQTLVLMVVLTSSLVTMRLVAEEKSKGTLEMILTAPISEAEFVLAKFAAALVLLVTLLLPTAGYVVIVSAYGQVDGGAVFCGYLGILLLGAVMYSIGLFISSLCVSQVTAGIVTFMIGVLLLVANSSTAQMAEESLSRKILEALSLSENFGDFLKGVVDTGRLAYLLSVTAFFLFLTTRVVESRRWR
jgi:ABC-2 type transport system permease protein